MIKKINNEREKQTQKYHTREKLPTNSKSTTKNTRGVFFLHVQKFYKLINNMSEKKNDSNQKNQIVI